MTGGLWGFGADRPQQTIVHGPDEKYDGLMRPHGIFSLEISLIFLTTEPGQKILKSSKHRRLEGYLQRLYGYAYSLSGDREEAKDLVQECTVKALSAREVPSDGSAYRAWLFKILRNAFFDSRRRRDRREKFEQLEAQNTSFMEYWDYDDRLINVITIKSELSRLDRVHREIIGLIDISGLSYADAADTLGIPVGTVMSRISRARAALLQAISEGSVRAFPIKRSS